MSRASGYSLISASVETGYSLKACRGTVIDGKTSIVSNPAAFHARRLTGEKPR
jgi:hypothetical protein